MSDVRGEGVMSDVRVGGGVMSDVRGGRVMSDFCVVMSVHVFSDVSYMTSTGYPIIRLKVQLIYGLT